MADSATANLEAATVVQRKTRTVPCRLCYGQGSAWIGAEEYHCRRCHGSCEGEVDAAAAVPDMDRTQHPAKPALIPGTCATCHRKLDYCRRVNHRRNGGATIFAVDSFGPPDAAPW